MRFSACCPSVEAGRNTVDGNVIEVIEVFQLKASTDDGRPKSI